jgi:class 3 adenylate cyclase
VAQASSVRKVDVATLHYRQRIVGFYFFAAMLASIPSDEEFSHRLALTMWCLLWPHLAYFIARRRGGDARSDFPNVIVDCFLGGVLASGYALRLWPTTATYSIGMLNAIALYGLSFLVRGIAISIAGLLASWSLLEISVHLETEPLCTAISIGAIATYVVIFGRTTYRLRQRGQEIRRALAREESRSSELLSNMLPKAIIPRLKVGENPIADQFADVTVIFADIVDFTPLSERLGPKRTVLVLNELFRRFDQAAVRLGVEKIETTGDGYLAVGGAPELQDNHPEAVADFALAIVEAARETSLSTGEAIEIRVGVHTGPVFAGVIGETRFHYKLFGETVNVASRIQGHSTPGRILVSETTFKRLQGKYKLQEHGSVPLKGHGPMGSAWLTSRA